MGVGGDAQFKRPQSGDDKYICKSINPQGESRGFRATSVAEWYFFIKGAGGGGGGEKSFS